MQLSEDIWLNQKTWNHTGDQTKARLLKVINKFFKEFINHKKKTNRVVVLRCRCRPIETRGAGGLQPPRFLLNFIFYELKEIALKWKIIQNYKTSCSSKFIDIYNIIIDIIYNIIIDIYSTLILKVQNKSSSNIYFEKKVSLYNETPFHIFYECDCVKFLWSDLIQCFQNTLMLPTLTPQTAILGILDSVSNNSFFENNKILINHIRFIHL